jgi:hypothetical protein
MAVTYLVLAHEEPAAVARLVARLQAPGHRVVLHVDRRVALAPFVLALQGFDALVLDDGQRRVCHWAGWSIAEAMLSLLGIAQAQAPADFYVFLSGADYPLRTPAAIEAALRNGQPRVAVWREVHRDRRTPLRRRHAVFGRTFNEVAWMNRREQQAFALPVRLLARTFVLGLKALSVLAPLRRAPGGMRVFRGSQWGALSAAQARAVSDWMHSAEGSALRRFFLRSAAPDEMLLPTLLRHLRLEDGVIDVPQAGVLHATHWIDWRDECAPAVLDEPRIRQALASGALFCRKLTPVGNSGVADLRARIDRTVDRG